MFFIILTLSFVHFFSFITKPSKLITLWVVLQEVLVEVFCFI